MKVAGNESSSRHVSPHRLAQSAGDMRLPPAHTLGTSVEVAPGAADGSLGSGAQWSTPLIGVASDPFEHRKNGRSRFTPLRRSTKQPMYPPGPRGGSGAGGFGGGSAPFNLPLMTPRVSFLMCPTFPELRAQLVHAPLSVEAAVPIASWVHCHETQRSASAAHAAQHSADVFVTAVRYASPSMLVLKYTSMHARHVAFGSTSFAMPHIQPSEE